MLSATIPVRETPTRQLARLGYARDPDKGLEHLHRLEEAPLEVSASRSGDREATWRAFSIRRDEVCSAPS